MNRRELLKRIWQTILGIPIAIIGLKTAIGKANIADEVPAETSGVSSEGATISYTEFLDANDNIFATIPGDGNINNPAMGLITKRTIWDDGSVTEESGRHFRGCTFGTPTYIVGYVHFTES